MKLPEFLTKNGFNPGAPEDFPSGSVDRAKALTIQLISTWRLASTTEKEWESDMGRAKKERAHELLGFADFDSYLKASIGKTAVEAKLLKHGGDRKSKEAKSRLLYNLDSRGTSTTYLRARLKRDFPSIFDALERGEYKSARAAGIAAGIVKVPSPLEQVKKLLPKLTTEEKRELRLLLK